MTVEGYNRRAYRKPGICTADLYCPICGKVTEHRQYTNGQARCLCLPCASRRERERKALGLPVTPRAEVPSEFDLGPGEQVCERCHLTVCWCEV